MTLADVHSRLIKCFSLVFPDLSEREIVNASPASVPTWDSIGSVTLFGVIEEEFSIKLKPEDLENFLSFDLILDFLGGKDEIS